MKQSYFVGLAAPELFERLTQADFWPDNRSSSRTRPMFWKDSVLENLMTINGAVTGPYGASLKVSFQIQAAVGNNSRISVSAAGTKDSYVSAHEFVSSVGEWVNALMTEQQSPPDQESAQVRELPANYTYWDLHEAVLRRREKGPQFEFSRWHRLHSNTWADYKVESSFLNCLEDHFRSGLRQEWVETVEEIELIYLLLLDVPLGFRFTNEELYWLLGVALHMGLDNFACNHSADWQCGIRKLKENGVHGQYPRIHSYAFKEEESAGEYSPLGQYARLAIEGALEELLHEEFELFDLDANERSITHMLAKHLEPWFPGYSVDCEYNRDGIDPKALILGGTCQAPVNWDLTEGDIGEGKTVYPDIIVHKRGTAENLLVVEAKKSSNKSPCRDKLKLQEYKRQLGFLAAFQVILPVGDEYHLYVQEYDWGSWKCQITAVEDIVCTCNAG
jgi:hypothetical protein